MAACGCKNRRGGQKIMHKSRDRAVDAAMSRRFLTKGGPGHEPYPCPKVKGVWHLRTVRRKKRAQVQRVEGSPPVP